MRADDFFARKAAESPAFKNAWDAEAPISVLALNVYRLRKEIGLTQAELGKRAGLSQPKIAKIERGDANPELRTLGRLAGALGITVGELMTDPYVEDVVDFPDVHAAVRHDAPEVHLETLSQYEIAPVAPFELKWDRARGAPVLRRTQHAKAVLAANDSFALAG